MKTGGMSCRVGERDGPSPSVLVESICKVRNGKVRYTADSTSTDTLGVCLYTYRIHLPCPATTTSLCARQVSPRGCFHPSSFYLHPFLSCFFPGFSSSYGYGFVTFLLSAPLSSLSSPFLRAPFLRAPFGVPSSTTMVGIEVEKKKLLQRHPTTSGKITRWEQECLSSLRV